jgi:hypothetical protein
MIPAPVAAGKNIKNAAANNKNKIGMSPRSNIKLSVLL